MNFDPYDLVRDSVNIEPAYCGQDQSFKIYCSHTQTHTRPTVLPGPYKQQSLKLPENKLEVGLHQEMNVRSIHWKGLVFIVRIIQDLD